jgi:hypothetical protein
MATNPPNADRPDTATPDNPLEVAQRRALIIDMHHAGRTFQQIGDRFGISRQRAHEIYWEAIDAIPAKAVASHRSAMLEQLAEVVRVANEVMAGVHIAHSNGRVVTLRDEDGKEVPLKDDGPKLDAARTLIAAQARWAKLIDADAPTRVEQSGQLRMEIVGVDPAELL